MAAKKTTKTALGKDPASKTPAPFDGARATRRVDYLKRVRPNDPEIKKLQAQIKKSGYTTASQNGNQPPPPPTQEERVTGAAGDVFEKMAGYAEQFDPRTFQAQYQPIYGAEMERARQNIMGQFERRNAEEFARQTQGLEQSIAERGLDPAGEAAQSLRKQLTQRQDLARQEALSAAESASDARQQAMYGQATGQALLPGQLAGQYMDPYTLAAQQRFAAGQQQTQFEQQKQLAAQQHRYNLEQIAKTPRGGGGGGQQSDPYWDYALGTLGQGYNQQPQVNPYATAAQGFLQGSGFQLGQRLNKTS
jgi:hypothetical protein